MSSIIHVHSEYSLFDSTQSPDEMVAKAKAIGCENITLTDHGTLLGVEPFMDAGKKYGVNTIPGVEAYMENRRHLLLVAKDYEGYQQISYAMRDANLHIEKVGKRMTFPIMENWILEKYFKGREHVFATTACIQGLISYTLLANFRIQLKINKLEEGIKELEESYREWKEASKEYRSYTQIIKELNKEKYSYNRYVTPAYLKKIENLKEKANLAKIQMETTFSDEKKYKNAVKKYKNAESNLEIAENAHKQADLQLQSLLPEIDENNRLKKSWKSKMTALESKKNKYLQLNKEIAKQEFIPEEQLYAEAKEQLIYLKSIFNTLFVELQYHGLEQEAYVMPILVRLAEETCTPVIAGNDAHMVDGSEASIEARRIIRFNYFDTAQTVSDADRTLYLKSDRELSDALCKILDESIVHSAIQNTKVLKQCRVEFPDEKHYPAAVSDKSFDELLAEAREQKIQEGIWNDEYEKRYLHEINVIKTMGFVDYHMIVRDFCNAGRKLGCVPKKELKNVPKDFSQIDDWLKMKNFRSGIGIGPGRGSAAGSLVCYLLGITNIDPIKYDLLFERFLNPERVSMPDIDSDVASRLRPTVINYIKWKYGERAVCSIATETTYGAKGAIQMAGRERASQLYGKKNKDERKKYTEKYIKMSDTVPEGPNVKLKDVENDIRAAFGNDKEAMLILDRAKLIEGKLCGTGVHAGGIVISDNDNINDYVPLAWNLNKEVWVAQCDMVRLEEKHLLKMDLLGLNNLDIISDCVQMIEKYHGEVIDLDHLTFEKEVFEQIYAKGFTNSIFQFESPGMKSMLVNFRPDSFEDLILLVAAYRPGPMQFLDEIIQVKNGKQVEYLFPELEEILSPTYGAIIYQESVMQIFQKLAEYSLGGADIVRRAMSKKKMYVLEKEREVFLHGDPERGIRGCEATGIDIKKADKLFDQMMDFAKYAFNRSHAAAYALVSYMTAWLKYHYPAEYLCAMLNNVDQDSYEPILSDCKELGIKILPPDINSSYYDFVLEDKNIRYGLRGIKGIGDTVESFMEDIINRRSKAEPMYFSFQDFLKRNLIEDGEKVSVPTRKFLENLIRVGVFDSFTQDREYLLSVIGKFEISAKGENADFVMKERINSLEIEKLPPDRTYNWESEMELLGTIISEDPLSEYEEDKKYGCIPMNLMNQMPDSYGSVFGLVVSMEEKKSKRGNNMLILKLQGKEGSCSVYLMNQLYDRYIENQNLLKNQIIAVKGNVSGKNIFAKTISKQSRNVAAYSLILDTIDDTLSAKQLLENCQSGPVNLYIQFWFGKNKAGELALRDTPLLHLKMISESMIWELQKRQMKIKKYDTSVV